MKARLRTWLRRLAAILALIALLPLVLAPLYRLVPPVSALMVRDLITAGSYQRDWVSFDAISPNMVRAVVAAEDGRFCAHHGVDWGSLRDVLATAGRDGPARGASTIAMQTVKNLFLWNARSYLRKAVEIPLALYADLVWSKRRTMEIYLNIAELGPRLYGVEAAARTYFGKPASALSRQEAALIAAALPNPLMRNPKRPTGAQKRYARLIAARAARIGDHLGCLYP